MVETEENAAKVFELDKGGLETAMDGSFETVRLRRFKPLPPVKSEQIQQPIFLAFCDCKENGLLYLFWRRGRDSNPGFPCEEQLVSSEPLSTTQPPLHTQVGYQNVDYGAIFKYVASSLNGEEFFLEQLLLELFLKGLP